jgi:hypothetical protein
MSYVVYNRHTTEYLRVYSNTRRAWKDAIYSTSGAAEAALTRAERDAVRRGKEFDRTNYAIAEKSYFHDNIEKQVTKKNLLTGKEFTQPINTPAHCDPSTETYHSM